ncbi:MAG: LamG-like jellyroll fold domain-containing protein, partial [Puniceicoccaceae bacterium]
LLPLLLLTLCLSASAQAAPEFFWQKDYAKVLPNGDLEWAPEPFAFEAAGEVRYIDYENGDDANDGASKAAPWKHHPWDANAAGNAKSGSADTYVFKGGVVYRGALSLPKGLSGSAETPVRLTRDPEWGEGEAVIAGSESVGGWTQGSAHGDIPDADEVWTAEVDFLPRNLWITDDAGQVRRIPLARTPNWEKSDPYDPMSEWWAWENPEWWKYQIPDPRSKTEKKNWGVVGIDTKNLTEDKDYYEGAVVRTEWGIVMGMPMPTEVEHFDPDTKTLSFSTPFLGAGRMIAGHRYFLENKPHYLDAPGEFWVEQIGRDRARIHLRLPDDADPNQVHIEAARRVNLIDGAGAAHLEISGLAFRFTNTPWRYWDYNFMDKDLLGAAFRILGPAENITVRNCTFEHVQKAVRIEARAGDQRIDHISIRDNDIRFVEHGAIHLFCTRPRKSDDPADFSRLGSIEVLRNNLYEIAFRFPKMGHEHAIHARYPERAHIAGNIIERTGQAGMDISGLKGHGQPVDAPYARVVIHQNKVTDPILMSNDWGALYINQGGPGYVFGNVVRNPGGFAHWKYDPKKKEGSPRFGHSYYVDGGYQKYLFNNIAWGRNNEQGGKYANLSAFQTLISFQNAVFNNTAHRFVQASRNQTPAPGRWSYLGNIYDDVSQFVFLHGKPAKGEADVNEADAAAGRLSDDWDYATVAYAQNAFHDITGAYGIFDSSGKVYETLPEFRAALETAEPLASAVGTQSEAPLLRDPRNGDMRPTDAVPGTAAKVFVPWALHATVGEWHFQRNHADPTDIIDTHWYMQPPYPEREYYIKMPRYPLAADWAMAEDYVDGPLENWTEGALRFRGRPAVLSTGKLNQGARYEHKKDGPVEVPASAFKTADMDTNSFTLEIYFQSEEPGGVLAEKAASGLGYQLSLDDSRPVLTLGVDGATARLTADTAVGDGWHHLLAEADREAGVLRLYLDGKAAGEGPLGLPADASLANDAPLLVGKDFHGAIDFLRIARGSLADAHTTIEELHAW